MRVKSVHITFKNRLKIRERQNSQKVVKESQDRISIPTPLPVIDYPAFVTTDGIKYEFTGQVRTYFSNESYLCGNDKVNPIITSSQCTNYSGKFDMVRAIYRRYIAPTNKEIKEKINSIKENVKSSYVDYENNLVVIEM